MQPAQRRTLFAIVAAMAVVALGGALCRVAAASAELAAAQRDVPPPWPRAPAGAKATRAPVATGAWHTNLARGATPRARSTPSRSWRL